MKRIVTTNQSLLFQVIQESNQLPLSPELGPGLVEIVVTQDDEEVIFTGSYYYGERSKRFVPKDDVGQSGSATLASYFYELIGSAHKSFVTQLGGNEAPKIIWEFCRKRNVAHAA